jgi:hypothetical protein
MAIIHRVGDPENASEAQAIKVLGAELPDRFRLIHNVELSPGHGLPYEYDLIVLGDRAVYHVEVKGYRGLIRGDRHQWRFENGGTYPSPIPLANKKTKVLATMLRKHGSLLDDVFVETLVLLTDDRARVQLKDEQADRVVLLRDAAARLEDPARLPVRTADIERLHGHLLEVVLGGRPSTKPKEIGLYRVLEQIAQHHDRTVYLAEHRYLKLRPRTVLKVFHYDVYAGKEAQEASIRAIFHDQEALRLLSGHPNIIHTGDFFAWEGDTFVLPTEYLDSGRPLEVLLDRSEDKQLSWAEKRQIVSGIAAGLRHAHRAGVIHRDVRPLNVVVAPGPTVKLVNFDLARIGDGPTEMLPPELHDRLDPRYVAPEVWRDPRTASPASDVYSLGILFYELITGERPYAHVDKVLAKGKVPLDLNLLRRELTTPGSEDFMQHPQDAIDTIAAMCACDPEQRLRTMDAVIEDLELVGD